MADLSTLPPTFVRCRTFGHAWDDVDATDTEQEQFDASWNDGEAHSLLVTECSRCSMRRIDIVHLIGGGLRSRRYTYPEGYLMPKGEHRPLRSDFRLELLGRRLRALTAGRKK